MSSKIATRKGKAFHAGIPEGTKLMSTPLDTLWQLDIKITPEHPIEHGIIKIDPTKH